MKNDDFLYIFCWGPLFLFTLHWQRIDVLLIFVDFMLMSPLRNEHRKRTSNLQPFGAVGKISLEDNMIRIRSWCESTTWRVFCRLREREISVPRFCGLKFRQFERGLGLSCTYRSRQSRDLSGFSCRLAVGREHFLSLVHLFGPADADGRFSRWKSTVRPKSFVRSDTVSLNSF